MSAEVYAPVAEYQKQYEAELPGHETGQDFKAADNKFIHSSLEEVLAANAPSNPDWQETYSSEGENYLNRQSQEWYYKPAGGKGQSLTESVKGTAEESRHNQIVEDLFAQGWSSVEYLDSFSGNLVKEVYFADETGKISFKAFELVEVEKNFGGFLKADFLEQDDDSDYSGTELSGDEAKQTVIDLNPVLKNTQAHAEATSWDNFWNEIFKPETKQQAEVVEEPNSLFNLVPAEEKFFEPKALKVNSEPGIESFFQVVPTEVKRPIEAKPVADMDFIELIFAEPVLEAVEKTQEGITKEDMEYGLDVVKDHAVLEVKPQAEKVEEVNEEAESFIELADDTEDKALNVKTGVKTLEVKATEKKGQNKKEVKVQRQFKKTEKQDTKQEAGSRNVAKIAGPKKQPKKELKAEVQSEVIEIASFKAPLVKPAKLDRANVKLKAEVDEVLEKKPEEVEEVVQILEINSKPETEAKILEVKEYKSDQQNFPKEVAVINSKPESLVKNNKTNVENVILALEDISLPEIDVTPQEVEVVVKEPVVMTTKDAGEVGTVQTETENFENSEDFNINLGLEDTGETVAQVQELAGSNLENIEVSLATPKAAFEISTHNRVVLPVVAKRTVILKSAEVNKAEALNIGKNLEVKKLETPLPQVKEIEALKVVNKNDEIAVKINDMPKLVSTKLSVPKVLNEPPLKVIEPQIKRVELNVRRENFAQRQEISIKQLSRIVEKVNAQELELKPAPVERVNIKKSVKEEVRVRRNEGYMPVKQESKYVPKPIEKFRQEARVLAKILNKPTERIVREQSLSKTRQVKPQGPKPQASRVVRRAVITRREPTSMRSLINTLLAVKSQEQRTLLYVESGAGKAKQVIENYQGVKRAKQVGMQNKPRINLANKRVARFENSRRFAASVSQQNSDFVQEELNKNPINLRMAT